MTKQENIEKAYGRRWNSVKKHVDEEGWFPDYILGNAIWVLSECERKYDENDVMMWRIASLMENGAK